MVCESVANPSTIEDILANIHRAKQEVKRWEREFAIAQERCLHVFERDRESDGHTTQFIYTCTKCYLATYTRPSNDLYPIHIRR